MSYTEQNEMNIFEYWSILVKHRNLIGVVWLLIFMLSIFLAYWMTPIYKADVLMIPISEEDSKKGLSGIVSQFGGLASLAGVDGGSGVGKNEAIATLLSRSFTNKFIQEQNLMPILFAGAWDKEKKTWKTDVDAPTEWDAYNYFNNRIRFISEDKQTGMIKLSIEWKNRSQAAEWGNLLVDKLNKVMRQQAINEAEESLSYLNKELERTSIVDLHQAIYRLIESQINKIMLANVRDQYSFKIIDAAVEPDEDGFIKPRRILIMFLGLLLGLVFSIFIAFVVNSIKRSKQT